MRMRLRRDGIDVSSSGESFERQLPRKQMISKSDSNALTSNERMSQTQMANLGMMHLQRGRYNGL